MPFSSSNPKPLSTLNSRNILAKENVPKPTLAPTSNRKGTTALVTKKGNSALTTTSSISVLKQTGATSVLQDSSKSITKTSQAPKLSNVQVSKGLEKENALADRSSTSTASRIPLRSIKKSAPATRSTTHTTVYARPSQGLKAAATTAANTTSNTSSTIHVSRKSSSFILDSIPPSTSSSSLPKEPLLSTTSSSSISSSSSSSSTSSSSFSSTYTSTVDSSTSKGTKSVPKKRVNTEETQILDTFSIFPRFTSMSDSEKENALHSHSISYPSSISKENVQTDDLLNSLTSTSRSKKLKTFEEKSSSDSALANVKYNKALPFHGSILEEEEEEEEGKEEKNKNKNETQTRKSKIRSFDAFASDDEDELVSFTNQENEPVIKPSNQLHVENLNFQTVDDEHSVSSFKSTDPDSTLMPAQGGLQRKESLDVLIPPSSVSLSEKMRKFGIPEIDLEDVEDVVLCAEYVQEILEYLLDREKMFMPNPNYITLHPELRWHMRGILVDWLMEVHQKFRFLPETLFLGVNIMDRFLSKRTVSLNKFQLVGLASLFIAAKIEEIFCPPVANFSYMADSAFNDDDMLSAEKYILKTLTFDTWAPGPFSFIRRISKIDEYNLHHRTAAKFFTEASLLDHRFLMFPPSLIAASAMYLARCVFKAPGPRWDASFAMVSGYMESELIECVQMFLRFFSTPSEPDSFFFKKYRGRTYQQVIEEMKALAHKMAGDFPSGTSRHNGA
ncbi:G2/mitotic-specific cyclin [Coelomomyces lativittatus]|nr:G2/mitotic-specific cyclin [Coelomomyces lativittatus]